MVVEQRRLAVKKISAAPRTRRQAPSAARSRKEKLSTSISQSTMVGLRLVLLLGFTLYQQVELGPAQYEEAAR